MKRDYESGQRRAARKQRVMTRRRQGKPPLPPINPKDSVDNQLRPIDNNGHVPDEDQDLCTECSHEQAIQRGMLDIVREIVRLRVLLEERVA